MFAADPSPLDILRDAPPRVNGHAPHILRLAVSSYLLVVNPKSGSGRGVARAEALRAGLADSEAVELLETERRGFAADAVAERAHDFEHVIAIGGDGTLNEVVTGLMRTERPADRLPALGFLASGTANAAIRAFGFGSDPGAVARALQTAAVRPVDVGVVSFDGGVRPFLLWLGAGYDAVVIDALNRKRTGLMGIAGLVRKSPAVARAVHRYPAPEIRVTPDGERGLAAASVILANVADMAFGGTVASGADPFDGRLDLLTVTRTGTVGVAALWLRAMASSLQNASGVAHTTATRVRLDADGEVPFQVDGEPVGRLPAEILLRPGAIRLLMT
ncbi:MAG: diacylglycerol kinase family protein [Gemmatimonadota bacterium]|jgi:diacylglycerol kinase family enzyme